MGRYVLSPSAQEDLDDIWDFSVEQWGDDRAERYVRALWAGIRIVADDTRRGHPFDLRDGYFRYSVEKHVLFFKLMPDGVDIIRILHQSMDFERHL